MRYRLYPTAKQVVGMQTHCAHARYVWNLAVEQLRMRHHHQRWTCPSERSRQLTEARQEFAWLGSGSSMVQQQALRDFDEAVRYWSAGTHGQPTWRKRGEHEGFRVVASGSDGIRVRQLNRRWSCAWIARVGWVKFRRSRAVPVFRSFRVTFDTAGRWHIAFAVPPVALTGPCDNSVVGIDRGVTVTLALSDGSTWQAPTPLSLRRAAKKLSRCTRGSNRRRATRSALARLHARNADKRKDFIEKASTHLARSYDLIRIEDLRVVNMTRSARGTVEMPGRNVRAKAGLNRAIRNSGWTMFSTRLQDKAPGRVEKINPAFTSQRCSVCGHVDSNSRKNQALFKCTSCGYTANADLNAARNIAAGRAVTARGASSEAVNREPQRRGISRSSWNPPLSTGEDVKRGSVGKAKALQAHGDTFVLVACKSTMAQAISAVLEGQR